MDALARVQQLGARFVDIEVMSGVIRVEGRNNGKKYAAKIKGRIGTPVLESRPMKGRYITNVVYKAVSHSAAEFESMRVRMTEDGLLCFDYIIDGLTVYIMPI